VRILEDGDRRIWELIDELPDSARARPGLGGGAWSPKDLVGHLATWERHGLDALQAWSKGEKAPIDARLWSERLSDLNAEWVDAKAKWPWRLVRDEADETHEALIEAIRGISRSRWNAPVSARGRKPMHERLGSILGGAAGPYRHAEAHVKSLVSFVEKLRH
jgi:hypothetical protein